MNKLHCFWGTDLGEKKNRVVYGESYPDPPCFNPIRPRKHDDMGVIATCVKKGHRQANKYFVKHAEAATKKAFQASKAGPEGFLPWIIS